MKYLNVLGTLLLPLFNAVIGLAQDKQSCRPNVILIMADDQGYGDLHCHGNDLIKTPNLDRLHDKSQRFTNYHVDPTSSPTRAALMTGRYSRRAGVFHTVYGRDVLRADEITMADVFTANGYQTGMFGKWHLGTNYPFRPMDRGFTEALYHEGGSISQMDDYWDNDRMNDHYNHNGDWKPYKGFSTEVFFNEAMHFIETHKDEPFFVYIPTSEPHGPYNTLKSWDKEYENLGLSIDLIQFFASITQVDKQVGRLRDFLKKTKLDKNTILIYTTDNGSTQSNYYNAGMRGAKGSVYEGGHRVPFFLNIPSPLLKNKQKDINQLAAHIDVLPTLMDLCQLNYQFENKLDGKSLLPIIQNSAEANKDRILFVDQQRIHYPQKGRNFAMMTQRWRLVNETALYDVIADPSQKKNVAKQYPHVVDSLNLAYETIWNEFAKRDELSGFARPIIGTDKQKVVGLRAIDLFLEGTTKLVVGQRSVREGVNTNGCWFLKVAQAGTYRFELRRWPKEANAAICDSLPAITSQENDIQLNRWGEKPKGISINVERARLSVNEQDVSKLVSKTDNTVIFDLSLDEGDATVRSWFYDSKAREHCVYYVDVFRLD